MYKIDNRKQDFIMKLFFFYILIQPFIDLATSLSVKLINIPFTVGTVIRFLFLALSLFYIVFVSQYKHKKAIVIYVFIFGIYLIFHFLSNLYIKPNFYLGQEITHLVKIVYFPTVLLAYIMVFNESKEKNWDYEEKVLTFIFYSMTIVGASMLIAGITQTAFNSYEFSKIGHVGWFYAANEIGAILAIGFPIVTLYAIRHINNTKTLYYWIPVGLLIYSLFAIGTKVGYGSLIAVVTLSLLLVIFHFYKNKTVHKTTLIMMILTTIFVALYTPFSPIAKNIGIHLSIIQYQTSQDEMKNIEKLDNEDQSYDNRDENVWLSGRDEFLYKYKMYYGQSPTIQQWLGMGYGSNFVDRVKLIEMDFYDLFFSLGIIGFTIYLIPFLVIIFQIIRSIFSDIKIVVRLDFLLLGSSILLGFGIAYIAGHVLYAPAVSIYLAIVISLLYNKTVHSR